jgi:ABC-type multidrug transport system fused ATPase/permease subunit
MNGLSIDLPAGKTLALVGASGCGKSTFLYLIERFYDCQGGSILIDNMDILKYDPQWLRDQVGLVQQEPVLFAMSIEDNIMYGSKICTHARVEQAARLAVIAVVDGRVHGPPARGRHAGAAGRTGDLVLTHV